MSCQDFRGLIHDHLERCLSTEVERAFEAHRGACADCSSFLDLCSELTCREFSEFLDEYVEGRLPAERQRVFERHLTVCTQCVDYLDSYRKTIELGRTAFDGSIPADVPEDLLRAVLDALGDGGQG